jgi:hypothetical protein
MTVTLMHIKQRSYENIIKYDKSSYIGRLAISPWGLLPLSIDRAVKVKPYKVKGEGCTRLLTGCLNKHLKHLPQHTINLG